MVDKFLKYIALEKRHSTHTLTSYQLDLSQFQDFLQEIYELEDLLAVDYNMLRSWIVALSEQGLKASSINRKIATLKSFYKFLQRKNYLEQNPTLRVKPLKTPKKVPVFVEEDSMNTLLDQLTFEEDFAGQRDKLILEMLYNTGMREAELISLQEKDIDFAHQQVKVMGKGAKERIIPLARPLLHFIQNYLLLKKQHFEAASPYLVVTDKGAQSYPMLIYRVVKKYLDLITTSEKKSPHVLRHTFATHLLNKGADLNAIKEILGHSSLKATQIYTHTSLERLKEIFEQAHPKA